jgi:hypothetical protein
MTMNQYNQLVLQ